MIIRPPNKAAHNKKVGHNHNLSPMSAGLDIGACPGQVEFVNYSCGASENCILLAPLGKNILYISGLLMRMCASCVVCHPSLS